MSEFLKPPPPRVAAPVDPAELIGKIATLFTLALAITALYVGRAVFIPIAIAVLLSFALAPLVRLLRRWRVPRVASVGLVVEHIRAGSLKPLAVLGKTRSPLLPEVPTMTEAGYPEINVVPWYGYCAPRGTPPAIVDKIAEGFAAALKDAKVRSALEKQGLQVMDPMTAAEIAALLASDTEKYGKIIKEADIKLSE